MDSADTFRPATARWVLGTSTVVAVVLVVGLVRDPGPGLLLQLAWPALVLGAGWAVFWAPHLRVDDSGVLVRNVLRTVHLPWPSIQRVDTKYTLTLCTADLECQVWAAPVAGRHSAAKLGDDDLRGLPGSTYGGGGIRPSDALTSPSGQAAYLVRRRWDALRDTGHLGTGHLDLHPLDPSAARATVHWNTMELAVGVVLVLAAVGTLL